MPFFLILLGLFGGWHYLLDHQPSMCQARAAFVAKQVPFALEILAARHPLSVGLIRSYLNKNGELDQLIQGQMTGADDSGSALVCAVQTGILHIMADQFRTTIADNFEKSLGIKEFP